MADSYRLQVLKALTDHLKGITEANGYDGFDLSEAVFRGRTVFGANDPVPMLSILENLRSDFGQFAGEDFSERSEQWNLMIQGWAVDDKTNPTDTAYALMFATEQHLFRINAINRVGDPMYPDEYRLGRTIGGIKVLPGMARPPTENVSSKAFFLLPIQVELIWDGQQG